MPQFNVSAPAKNRQALIALADLEEMLSERHAVTADFSRDERYWMSCEVGEMILTKLNRLFYEASPRLELVVHNSFNPDPMPMRSIDWVEPRLILSGWDVEQQEPDLDISDTTTGDIEIFRDWHIQHWPAACLYYPPTGQLFSVAEYPIRGMTLLKARAWIVGIEIEEIQL